MSSVRRRPTPLRVGGTGGNRGADPADEQGPGVAGTDGVDAAAPPGDGLLIGHDAAQRTTTEEDRRSFVAAVRSLRTGTGALNLSERTLMVAGGVLAPLGLLLVLLGWLGAARTPNLFEQIPYLISGGLFGLGLVFLGAFFYFAHWITELVKESRAQSAALLDAIEGLREEIGSVARGRAAGLPAVGNEPTPLVATLRGSMAHRPDCVVVAGKEVQPVTVDDSLMPCKMCDPFEQG